MAGLEIDIRPASAADIEGASGFGRMPLPDHWRAGVDGRSFVAIVDRDVVGHAWAVDNVFHPATRTLVVEVLPPFRGQGVGSALLAAHVANSTRPLRMKVEASRLAERSMARRFGGVAVQAVPPRRHAVTPELRDWAGRRLDEVETPRSGDALELLDLSVRHYVAQHARWSPADAQAVRSEFSADFKQGEPPAYEPASTVLRRGHRAVAAALVWPDEDQAPLAGGHEVSLVCLDPSADVARADMEACLAGVIRRCRDDAALLIDFHVTEPVEAAIACGLPRPEAHDGDDWMAIVSVPAATGPRPTAMPASLLPPEAAWIAEEFGDRRR